MLVYLDNGENVKKHPNENFGRELLELFTMGVGNYTERDVREAARAFTGWTNDVLAFKFDAEQHDFGEKTFLGRTGPFNGEDIIDIILAQPVTGGVRVRRSCIGSSCARRSPPPVKAELGRTFRDERLPDQAAAEADLPLEGFLQPAVVRDADQEPGASGRVDLQEDGPARGADDSGLRPHDGQPRTVAVRSAERRRLGRRPHLDHAVDAAAARQPVSRRALSRTSRASVRPIARCRPPTRASGERLAQGHEHHRGHQGRRRGDAESNMMVDRDEDYNTRYGGYNGNLLAFERTKLIPRSRPRST